MLLRLYMNYLYLLQLRTAEQELNNDLDSSSWLPKTPSTTGWSSGQLRHSTTCDYFKWAIWSTGSILGRNSPLRKSSRRPLPVSYYGFLPSLSTRRSSSFNHATPNMWRIDCIVVIFLSQMFGSADQLAWSWKNIDKDRRRVGRPWKFQRSGVVEFITATNGAILSTVTD